MTGIHYVRPPWAAAFSDENLLVVWRSLAVSTDDEDYRPIADYIRDSGVVLVKSAVLDECSPFLGQTEHLLYATPRARDALFGAGRHDPALINLEESTE